VYNYDFRYFSHADYTVEPIIYGVPDGWIYQDNGPASKISLDDCDLLIQTSNDETSIMTFKQALHEFPRWRETLCRKNISARIQVHISANCKLRASLYDGVSARSDTWCNTQGGYYEFELSLNVSESAECLYISLQSNSNAAIIKISKIYANFGDIAIDGLGCIVQGVIGETKQYIVTENAPAEELNLCTKGGSRELTENETRLNSVIAGRFGLGVNNRSMLPDMRGYFIRVWDNGAQVDPDAANRPPLGIGAKARGDHVGSRQSDEFKEHFHEIQFSADSPKPGGKETVITPIKIESDNTSKVGGKETRGKNLYQLFTMRWA
jgi:hypothetical protein